MEKLTHHLKNLVSPSRIIFHKQKGGQIPGVITTFWVRGDQYLYAKENKIALGPLVEKALDIILDTSRPLPEGQTQTQIESGLSVLEEYHSRQRQQTLAEADSAERKNAAIRQFFPHGGGEFKNTLPENDRRCTFYTRWNKWAEELSSETGLTITAQDLQEHVRGAA